MQMQQSDDNRRRPRRDEDDEDKGRVKKIKKTIYMVVGSNKYFMASFTSDAALNRAMRRMQAANRGNREYVVETDVPARKPRKW
jgi:hypothetical protein